MLFGIREKMLDKKKLLLCFCLLLTIHITWGQSEIQAPTSELLQELAQYRQQFRRTIDGRLCAAVFVQDFQTYTDCTIARSPDGTSGREWCYVEPQVAAQGVNNWNYCLPIVNYDLVRAKASEAFEIKVKESGNIAKQLDNQAARLMDILERYNNTCGSQQTIVSSRLDHIETLIQKGQHCLNKIEESITKIDVIKTNIDELEKDIARDRDLALSRPENCELLPGYEDIPFPDGLRGVYYDNPTFEGTPRNYRTDRNINMMYISKDPIDGVSNQQFSVRWDGFLLAPESGRYYFSIEADCGARVFLGGRVIIVDRMPQPSSGDATAERPVPILLEAKYDGPHKVTSVAQELIGGQKYRIRVEMFHSSHLRFSNPDMASIKLMWRTSTIQEQIIPGAYFYTGNPHQPLKLSGVNPVFYEISTLRNGELAHKNADNYYIADVPSNFEGLKMLKTLPNPDLHEMNLHVNQPCTLFIAADVTEKLPISSESLQFVHTDSVLSVYKTDSKDNSKASETQTMKVAKVYIPRAGEVKLKVDNSKPFILFFQQNMEQIEEELQCSEELLLSTKDFIESVKSSSAESSEYTGEYGLGGKNTDTPYGTWKTSKGNTIGESLLVKFKQPVKITSFQYIPLDNPSFWPSSLTMHIKQQIDETHETTVQEKFHLAHSTNPKLHRYTFQYPIISKELKIEISQMFVDGSQTGGSFIIYGESCQVKSKEKE
ncbi:PA14 domain-containing protein [Cryptosporidium muris RN66]|uniref:PA14 domain-containing protein n=1 Tax=Cryptosporidium muris (strain RN66) TaxID=441375 RepID=B6AF56_CRYMR|nr:PA14 domain-containing protein [Cryptosporidium muris RN66]EEA06823.1 PA14 domain-containing protein [Cryptosporidium muris RN66]|eukprot:XP_002141172.1 PA14 domain-containing protein [Cryptosporidium muris RN66]